MQNADEVHGYSRSAVKLHLRKDGEERAVGSGIVVKIRGPKYLITAAHNLSGKEPDGKPKSATGWLPNEVIIRGYHTEAVARLYDGENDPSVDKPTYVQDAPADIAILYIHPSNKVYYPLDESFVNWRDHAVLKIGVGDPCFIVGYPRGIETDSGEGPLPIWKAATVASEPRYASGTQPLLVDTWGETGLSGSAALTLPTSRVEPRRRLIGIYTGRRFTQGGAGAKEESLGTITPTEAVIGLFEANERFLVQTSTRLFQRLS